MAEKAAAVLLTNNFVTASQHMTIFLLIKGRCIGCELMTNNSILGRACTRPPTRDLSPVIMDKYKNKEKQERRVGHKKKAIESSNVKACLLCEHLVKKSSEIPSIDSTTVESEGDVLAAFSRGQEGNSQQPKLTLLHMNMREISKAG